MANAATNHKPVSKYPATKVSSYRRGFHSRCRGYLRFSLFVRASVLKSKKKRRVCCSNEEISGGKVILSDQKPTLKLHKKDKEVTELSDEGHVGDSTSKGSSFKQVQTWGVRNGKNGNNLRVSVLRRFPLLVKKHVEVSHEPFLPLKEEEEAAVKSAFSVRNRMKVLVSHENSNIDIRGETLQCLKPCAWLNDEVINLYLELLKERETREPEKHFKCHFFNTFFYIKHGSFYLVKTTVQMEVSGVKQNDNVAVPKLVTEIQQVMRPNEMSNKPMKSLQRSKVFKSAKGQTKTEDKKEERKEATRFAEIKENKMPMHNRFALLSENCNDV